MTEPLPSASSEDSTDGEAEATPTWSPLSSGAHRVQTRLRLLRMYPRRARARRSLLREGPAGRPVRGPSAIAGSGRPPRVLAIIHVYYPELWPELAAHIVRIPAEVDVVVTLVRGRADGLGDQIMSQFPGAVVRVVENRGRDMWPLVQVLDQVGDQDAVLKLHTKRSPHMRNGDAWRNDLLSGLCGDPDHVRRVLQLLTADERIGFVAPDRNVLGKEFLSANGPMVESLVRRSGVTFEPDLLWFPAGSMFWARPSMLTGLADLHLRAEDFGPEAGSIDGTMAHALERYLGVLAAADGRAVVESSDVERLVAARP